MNENELFIPIPLLCEGYFTETKAGKLSALCIFLSVMNNKPALYSGLIAKVFISQKSSIRPLNKAGLHR